MNSIMQTIEQIYREQFQMESRELTLQETKVHKV